MIELINKPPERAALVLANLEKLSKETIKERLDELESLAKTAGADVIFKSVQERNSADPAYYIGRGKAEEIAALVETNNIDIVIFDDELSPVQARNLEKTMKTKIVDRTALILDIFAFRAKTNEAKTQVELAQLEYLLPRLTRAWTHLSKQYGGIGTKGPGETQIETDRRIIRTRISKLKDKLEKIESRRKIKNSNRNGYLRTSLVGYTNAGKSTLLNLLTNAGVLAEDKLFATLDPTARALVIDRTRKMLLSDTVGFIRKLPHRLVASFKSTLNEVKEADLILHIIDASHPFYEEHIEVVEQILKELGCDGKNEIKVFNKIDALNDFKIIREIKLKHANSVFISAARGINIGEFRKKLEDVFNEIEKEETAVLKNSDSKTISLIHSFAKIISKTYKGDNVIIRYKADKVASNKIKKIIYENSGS